MKNIFKFKFGKGINPKNKRFGLIFRAVELKNRSYFFFLSIILFSNEYEGVLYEFDPHSLKPTTWYYRFKYQVWPKARKNLIHRFRMLFDKSTVYVSIWTRDCDMVEGTYTQEFESYRDYYNYFSDYDNCSFEGPTEVTIISKDEYDELNENPPKSRDRVMEAYENGRGNSIIL